MKIIGINCSPRKNRTTQKSLETCLDAAREESARIETEIIELADLNLRGCLDCGYCKKQLKCKQEDDLNSLIPILSDKNIAGIIMGTPVYLGTMTSQCKAFLDRSVVFRRNGFIFRNKVGGVLAIGGVRNGGQELTIQAVQAALMCHDMICVSDGFNTCHFGATLFSGGQGGLDADTFGLQTAQNLGRRVAQMALLLIPHKESDRDNKWGDSVDKTIPISPIGIIHSPYKQPKDMPIQGRFKPGIRAWVELQEEYIGGLKDLNDFSHAIIIYYFHKSEKIELEGKPFLEDHRHGIFAIRSPHRPNHIGLSIVKIENIETNKLYFSEVDVLDGTPVLDIKPYVKQFDARDNAVSGWLEKHFQGTDTPDKTIIK